MAQKKGKENSLYEGAEQKIRDAFFCLVEVKGYEKVTVSQIIEESGVNRSTFYRHYQDKDAIVESVKAEALPYTMQLMQMAQVEGDFLSFIANLTERGGLLSEEEKKRFLLLSRIHTARFELREFICQGLQRQYQIKNPKASMFETELFAEIIYSSFLYTMQGYSTKQQESLRSILQSITDNV